MLIEGGQLQWGHRPDPEPTHDELLIAVKAAGVNAADLMQRAGMYPAPPGVPSDIPGLELAGEVIEVGAAVRDFRPGDRVMAVVAGGAQAELAVVHERCAMSVPTSLPWIEAGGFPEAFSTAFDGIVTQCQLGVGERLCVHAAAGGVGIAAVQLGVAAGAHVVATVRSEALRAKVAAFGATVVAPEDFVQHGPFDVVLELIGAPNLDADLDALATGGRISVIGVGGGAIGEVNLLKLMSKRGRIHGSTLRPRPLEDKAAVARRMVRQVVPLADDSLVRVPVEQTYAMKDAALAYERFAQGGKLGKIILTND